MRRGGGGGGREGRGAKGWSAGVRSYETTSERVTLAALVANPAGSEGARQKRKRSDAVLGSESRGGFNPP